LDSTWYNQYDFVTDRSDSWRVWSAAPALAFEVYAPIPGDTRPWPYHLIDLYTQTTGRPMLAPESSYRPPRRIGHRAMQNGTTELQAMRDLHLAITAFDDANHFPPRGVVPGELPAFTVDNAAKGKLGYRAVAYFNPFMSDNPGDPIAPLAAAGASAGYF